jgi:hypothetical protein
MKGVKDPVAGQESIAEEVVSMKNYTFKPIPPSAAKLRKPFEGYPFKKFNFNGITEITDNKIPLYEQYIVALNPMIHVVQDRSNKKVKTKKGMEQINTYHSRVIRDTEEGENTIVHFDRPLVLDGKTYFCAIVPSHNVRAQLCFKYDARQLKIVIDDRYMLLDNEQAGKLKDVYAQVLNPKLKMEKESAFISGETTEDVGGAELPEA